MGGSRASNATQWRFTSILLYRILYISFFIGEKLRCEFITSKITFYKFCEISYDLQTRKSTRERFLSGIENYSEDINYCRKERRLVDCPVESVRNLRYTTVALLLLHTTTTATTSLDVCCCFVVFVVRSGHCTIMFFFFIVFNFLSCFLCRTDKIDRLG